MTSASKARLSEAAPDLLVVAEIVVELASLGVLTKDGPLALRARAAVAKAKK